jgi:hypothetical protein
VSPNLANLSVSAPEQVPMPTTLSSMSTVGMAMTHSRFLRRAAKEWFHSPVTMANPGVKSITMVQEMVMMLALFPSWVVTRTTGPGFHQGEGLAQFQLAHDRSLRDAVGLYPGLAGTLGDLGAPTFKITGRRGSGGLMVWASLI